MQNIDLVPADMLERLRQLDRELPKTVNNLKAMLAPAKELSAQLAKTTLSYKGLSEAIERHNRTAAGVQTAQKQLLGIQRQLTQSQNTLCEVIGGRLVGALDKSRQAGERAAAQGGKGASVWKQLTSSLLSWHTVLDVGITVVTTYGRQIGEFVKRMFSGREAALSMADAAKEVNQAMEFTDVGAQVADFNKLAKAWRDLGDDAEAKKQFLVDYRDEIDKTGIAVYDINDAENLFVTNTQAYIDSIKLRAKAKAGEKLASEQYSKAIEEEADRSEKLSKLRARRSAQEKKLEELNRRYSPENRNATAYVRQARAIEVTLSDIDGQIDKHNDKIAGYIQNGDKYIGIAQQMLDQSDDVRSAAGLDPIDDDSQAALQDRIDTLKNLTEAERKAIADLRAARQEANAESLGDIFGDAGNSYNERMSALRGWLAQRQQIITEAAQAQIDQQVRNLAAELGMDADNAEQRQKLEEKLANTIAGIRYAASLELVNAEQEFSQQQKDIARNTADELIRQAGRTAAAQGRKRAGDESSELGDLAAEYAAGLRTKEEYEQAKNEIAKKYRMMEFDDQIALLEQNKAILQQQGQDTLAVDQQIADARLKYAEWVNAEQVRLDEAAAEKRQQIEENLSEKKKELFAEVMNFMSSLNDAWAEKQLEELDEEQESEEERFDQERERIERLYEAGAISKEEADARKRAVDDQEQARMEEIEQKRRQVQQEQARFEKAQAVAQIIISTALAVVKALPNIPLSITVGAIGAAQLATVMAQPIPEYATGTASHPGGLAIVGDGHRPEMILTPSGAVLRTPAVATLMDLERGSAVLPDYDLALQNMAAVAMTRQPQRPDDRTSKEMVLAQKESTETIRRFMNKFGGYAKNQRYQAIYNGISPIKKSRS